MLALFKAMAIGAFLSLVAALFTGSAVFLMMGD